MPPRHTIECEDAEGRKTNNRNCMTLAASRADEDRLLATGTGTDHMVRVLSASCIGVSEMGVSSHFRRALR